MSRKQVCRCMHTCAHLRLDGSGGDGNKLCITLSHSTNDFPARQVLCWWYTHVHLTLLYRAKNLCDTHLCARTHMSVAQVSF